MKAFGVLHNSLKVYEYTIHNKNGISLSAINYGGIITKLFVPDSNHTPINIVLGYSSLNEYVADPFYIGALIGPNANRIKNAECYINSERISITKNHREHNLHAGNNGFNTAFWDIKKEVTENEEKLILTLQHIDGLDGFPGNLNVTVVYILTNTNEFIIEYSATTDKDTLANFTQHSYFNLSGFKENSIENHTISIFSNSFLDLTSDGIPTGKISPVNTTVFNNLENKKISDILCSKDSNITLVNGIDHCFLCKENNSDMLVKMAELYSPSTKIKMTVYGTQPAMQCYTGNFLNNAFVKHQGICLETQAYTDACNNSNFPSVILEKGKVYKEKTVFGF